jgi:type IV secretory pathway VirB4 component
MVEKEVLDCMNDIIKKVVKKEERRLYDKERYQKNKEKILQQQKEWYEKNKEKIKEDKKQYYQTDQGIKSHRIGNWKQSGLICDNYDELYNHYLKTAYCDACKVELTYDKKTTATTKCMDHCHETGLFRNILCHRCNSKRRQDNILPNTTNPCFFVGLDD